MLVNNRHREVDEVASLMSRGRVYPLDVPIAMLAAELGIKHRLPMADSIIYATARHLGLTVWTQDRDFSELAGVRYVS